MMAKLLKENSLLEIRQKLKPNQSKINRKIIEKNLYTYIENDVEELVK